MTGLLNRSQQAIGWADRTLKFIMLEIKNYSCLDIKDMGNKAGSILKFAVDNLPKGYWLSAGTCLGLYRDNEFIKGDTDIDVAYIWNQKLENLLRKSMHGQEIGREVKYDGKLMQLVYMIEGCVLDIYFHYPEGDRYINHSQNGKQFMPKHIYDSVKDRDTKYGKLPFLDETEHYLEIRYGDDWHVPQDKKPINYE